MKPKGTREYVSKGEYVLLSVYIKKMQKKIKIKGGVGCFGKSCFKKTNTNNNSKNYSVTADLGFVSHNVLEIPPPDDTIRKAQGMLEPIYLPPTNTPRKNPSRMRVTLDNDNNVNVKNPITNTTYILDARSKKIVKVIPDANKVRNEWVEMTSKTTDKKYYYNPVTRESRWTLPDDVDISVFSINKNVMKKIAEVEQRSSTKLH